MAGNHLALPYPLTKILENKAKAISAKLLELNLKNKLEETGKKTIWNGKKREKTEKLEEENTENKKKLDDTERNRKKQEETGRNRKKPEETVKTVIRPSH